MRVCKRLVVALLLGTGVVAPGGPRALAGLDPEGNTDGFDPGVESHRINEARRLNNVARQLSLVYQMQWENPYFPGELPVRQPIGYESKQVGPNRWIYRPVYPEDVAGDVETLPEPQSSQGAGGGAQPQAPAPADAKPGDKIPPKPIPPQRARTPREF
jgi:hypothetical protein